MSRELVSRRQILTGETHFSALLSSLALTRLCLLSLNCEESISEQNEQANLLQEALQICDVVSKDMHLFICSCFFVVVFVFCEVTKTTWENIEPKNRFM